MLQNILDTLNLEFSIVFDRIEPYRDMIGYVCMVWAGEDKYVLKLFRKNHTRQAIQSVEIMRYLYEAGYPVAQIISTLRGMPYFLFDFQNESRIGVLYEFIDGTEPDKESDMEAIGWQTGQLHKCMNAYKTKLIEHSKEYFIDRYMNILTEMKYPEADRFQELGDMLWQRVEGLPKGFCHGDYHPGNMIKNTGGQSVLFDFDAAANAFPVYDIAVFCDTTDYFAFREQKFHETAQMLKRFLKGYSKHMPISSREKASVYDFIAIRHFEAQATIIENLGFSCVDNQFIDDQFNWLMEWEKAKARYYKK